MVSKMDKNIKQRCRKLFIYFFVCMFLLTILSRILDSVMLPKVSVGGYSSGSLKYLIEGEGVIKAAEIGYVDIPEGIRVERVLARGEKVEAGQGIVFLSLSDLEDKKKEKERELEKLQLSLEREKLNAKPEARITQQERIAGDLALGEKQLQDATLEMQKAEQEYEQGVKELEKKRERDKRFAQLRLLFTKDQIQRANSGLDKNAAQSLAQPELDYSVAVAGIDDSYESSLKQLESKLEQAAAKLNEMQKAYSGLSHNAALAAKEDENTARNEQKTIQLSGKTQGILQVDIDARKEEIQVLDKLLQSGGQVESSVGGVVTKMDMEPGAVTARGEIAGIGCGEFLFMGSLGKEETGLLEEGDVVEISMPMQEKNVIGNVLNININIDTDDAGGEKESFATFTARMEGEDFRVGSVAGYQISKSSKQDYSCLIPIEAVREDGNSNYCLIAEEQSTILGKEDIAVRINIEVIQTDDNYAAVKGVFTDADRIITGSNKEIKEGDRVRIQA